jgi:hypothetical protein
MIGGIDVYIPTRAGRSSVEIAVRAIRQIWPRAVFENALTGDRYNHFWEIPFGDLEELFVYHSATAADIWESEGAIAEVYNMMVHIIDDKEMIIVVVDDKDAPMEKILAAIRSGLSDDILHIPVSEAA